MTDEETKQLRIGSRMKRSSNSIIRVVREIVERGVVVTMLNGSHKELFEWGYLTAPDQRGALKIISL